MDISFSMVSILRVLNLLFKRDIFPFHLYGKWLLILFVHIPFKNSILNKLLIFLYLPFLQIFQKKKKKKEKKRKKKTWLGI